MPFTAPEALFRLAAILVAAPLAAAVPDRDWPSVVVTPILDVPMRDTAITRGPEGTYYLTGTIGSRKITAGGQKLGPHPTSNRSSGLDYDYDNTREVRAWRSDDLKTWSDLGVIYDIHDPQYEEGGHWQRNMRFKPDRPEGDQFVRGITEPELHHIKGAWWLCFSINGEGTGLAKSTTGKPEGPYRHHARITAQGGSPSMFEDDDGTVYWLIDGGRIAPLTDNLRALAKPPRQIVPAPSPMGGAAREILAKNPGSAPLSDEPGVVGTRGAFLFKRDGYYFLTAAADHKRLLSRCNDTWIAYATSLDGPWSERHLMIHHGGGITVFEGPDNSLVTEHRGRYDSKLKQHATGPQLYATFAATDERAILRDRASFIPLEWVGPKRWDVEFFKHAESFPRKPQAVITVGGPFAHLKPLAGIGEVRDIAITLAPDGFYYLGGSLTEKRGELYLYRSLDLMKWELVGPFWKAPAVEAEKRDFANKDDPRTILWSGRLFHLHGKYYLTCSLPGTGVVAFRSKTGSALGPYEELGKVGGVFARDRNHSAGKSAFFTGPDGKLYCNGWMDWILQVAEVPARVLQKPGWPMNYKPVDIGRGNWMCRDDYGMVMNIEGLYVYTAYTGGSADSGVSMGTGHYGNDGDGMYAVGPTPWGPFREFKAVHSVEYSEFLKDKEGQWWAVVFFTDNSDPFWLRASLIPLDVRRAGNDLTIALKESGYTQRELKIMGGGEIAAVLTVPEILKDKGQ